MKLCYVDENMLWFSEHEPKEVTGDDWNDAPYEHNCGNPYDEYGPFYKIMYHDTTGRTTTPKDHYINSPYSVDIINTKQVAWIVGNGEAILAGDTPEDCIEKLRKMDCLIFLPLDK